MRYLKAIVLLPVVLAINLFFKRKPQTQEEEFIQWAEEIEAKERRKRNGHSEIHMQ